MKQETAVEWLWDNWKDKCNSFEELVSLFKQAKDMEKEQMIEFFMKGQNTYPSEYVLENQQIAEQYYNETFKSE